MRELTSLDLKFLIPELKDLIGAKIQKTFQDKKQIRIELFVSGKGTVELYFEPGKLFITNYKRKAPEKLERFATYARKHLKNQKIKDVRQIGFERIIEIETDSNIIIFELFPPGNVIICDNEYKILLPLQIKSWKTRKIASKQQYFYPPEINNPFDLSLQKFKKLESEKATVKFIAADLSLSGLYAEEVCERAQIDKYIIFDDLTNEEKSKLFIAINSLTKMLGPQTIGDDVVPFDMKTYQTKEPKRFVNFNAALDEFYSKQLKKQKPKKTKVEKVIEKQKHDINKLEKNKLESKKAADYIYNNYVEIDDIIHRIKTKKKLPEGVIVDNGKGFFTIDNIKIDFKQNAQINAQKYFTQFKKYKKKFESAQHKTDKVIEKIKEKEEKKIVKVIAPRKREKGEWYEKFHWFYTTDNLLVIAGRNATQNDMIFKKYVNKDDIILHAEIVGAPLTIIKSKDDEEIPLDSIKQAADAAGAYSSAWKKGVGSIDVYWITPEQVSKTPESGEYLNKGSFVIRGKKNYLKRVELKVAIGYTTKVIGGPVDAVRKLSPKHITIKPGFLKPGEIIKKINKRFPEAIPDDIQKFIPAGKSQII